MEKGNITFDASRTGWAYDVACLSSGVPFITPLCITRTNSNTWDEISFVGSDNDFSDVFANIGNFAAKSAKIDIKCEGGYTLKQLNADLTGVYFRNVRKIGSSFSWSLPLCYYTGITGGRSIGGTEYGTINFSTIGGRLDYHDTEPPKPSRPATEGSWYICPTTTAAAQRWLFSFKTWQIKPLAGWVDNLYYRYSEASEKGRFGDIRVNADNYYDYLQRYGHLPAGADNRERDLQLDVFMQFADAEQMISCFYYLFDLPRLLANGQRIDLGTPHGVFHDVYIRDWNVTSYDLAPSGAITQRVIITFRGWKN